MPYSGIPTRRPAIASKAIRHGQVVVENNFVGTAFKADQADRWTKPADAQKIAVGEEYEMQLLDIAEIPLSGAIDALGVGAKVFITVADNTFATAAGAGVLPVGIIDEIDTARDVARVNTTAWWAFA